MHFYRKCNVSDFIRIKIGNGSSVCRRDFPLAEDSAAPFVLRRNIEMFTPCIQSIVFGHLKLFQKIAMLDGWQV